MTYRKLTAIHPANPSATSNEREKGTARVPATNVLTPPVANEIVLFAPVNGLTISRTALEPQAAVGLGNFANVLVTPKLCRPASSQMGSTWRK